MRTSEHRPLLLQAVLDRYQAAVELLLEQKRGGVEHDARADKIQLAVELLLAHHADANAANENGRTPLHFAAELGDKAIAELLLKAGADVNARGMNGETPLWVAVDYGQRELAELLLANKADPNERNNAGQTPLDLAKSQAQSAPGQPPGAPRAFPGAMAVPPGALPGPPPLNYQWAPGTPAPATPQESKPEAMVDLLRRHGAADDLPRLDCISLRRPSVNYSSTVFFKGTNNWNHFSLFELIAVHYGFLAGWPVGESRQWIDRNVQRGWPFPDFARLRIRRPGADLKSWEEKTIDLATALQSTNCTADIPLAWGDVIDIPESDHPLDQNWPGFSMADFATLEKCLARQVEIVIKGQSTNITLLPDARYVTTVHPLFAPPVRNNMDTVKKAAFWIKPVLRDSGLLLASSDLSRVKVTHRDPATGQMRVWVVDCSDSDSRPAPELWLRDGDKIEVPEKTDSASAE